MYTTSMNKISKNRSNYIKNTATIRVWRDTLAKLHKIKAHSHRDMTVIIDDMANVLLKEYFD